MDAARALAVLNNGGRRMAFAVVNALNKTAKAIQIAEREHAQRAFTVRRPDFFLRQAAVISGAGGGSGFASVSAGRFEARISVGDKPRLLLSGFEEGAERKAFVGKNVAVPRTGGPARPSFSSSVETAFTFKNLNLRKVTPRGQQKRKSRGSVSIRPHVTASGKVQWKGTQRTFLLTETSKAPLGGVFQRIGPGKDDIRMVYTFARPKRLDRRLRFIETGKRIAEETFQRNLLSEVEKTLAYNVLWVRL